MRPWRVPSQPRGPAEHTGKLYLGPSQTRWIQRPREGRDGRPSNARETTGSGLHGSLGSGEGFLVMLQSGVS